MHTPQAMLPLSREGHAPTSSVAQYKMTCAGGARADLSANSATGTVEEIDATHANPSGIFYYLRARLC